MSNELQITDHRIRITDYTREEAEAGGKEKELENISKFAIAAGYDPTFLRAVTDKETKEAIEMVEEVRRFVLERIK
ncbi:MAG TPA: hypothetical protein ENF36_07625 [Desulfobacteraceae bacterium]|nr:hypothetical protein [Desulfobacteraceae bacterium]